MNISTVMREYLNNRIPGCESVVATMSTDRMRSIIENDYEGGYESWSRDWLGRTSTDPGDTQVTRRAKLKSLLGYLPQIGSADILHISHDDDIIKVILRVTESRESTFRMTETKAWLRLETYDRETCRRNSALSVADDVTTYLSGHARVMTPERYLDVIDQYLTCHRPGTERSPMDGPEHDSRYRQDVTLWYQLMELGLATVGEE